MSDYNFVYRMQSIFASRIFLRIEMNKGVRLQFRKRNCSLTPFFIFSWANDRRKVRWMLGWLRVLGAD